MGGKINSPGGLPAAPAQRTQREQDFVHSLSQQMFIERCFPKFIILFISDSEDTRIPRNVPGNTLRSEVIEQAETRQGNQDGEELATTRSFIHSFIPKEILSFES